MKKSIALLLLIVVATTALGQKAQFGIKGGLNFGSTGDITDITNQTFDGENRLGYHLGVLAKFKFAGISLQPEVVFTQLQTEFEDTVDANYNLSIIDVPILVGFDIVGPLTLKVGPAFQLLLNNELDISNVSTSDPENSFTLGYQLGAGVQLGRLGLDLRFESAFSENNALLTDDILQIATIDNRPSQWILSVSYLIQKSKK